LRPEAPRRRTTKVSMWDRFRFSRMERGQEPPSIPYSRVMSRYARRASTRRSPRSDQLKCDSSAIPVSRSSWRPRLPRSS